MENPKVSKALMDLLNDATAREMQVSGCSDLGCKLWLDIGIVGSLLSIFTNQQYETYIGARLQIHY